MADKIFDRSNTIYVKNSPRKGRGVFANVPFKAGEVIERAPTWGFDDVAAKLLDRTGILEYYFVRPDQPGESPADQPSESPLVGYVVFGFISIVNHSSNPNAQTVWAYGNSGAWATIVAIKDIQVDEEITHRYSNISAYPKNIKFVD
ncbi:SET domain-containing protein-lysine N-methyltransferase [Mesorhizobium ventifaucium]|uniref:SET domain-containing protein n=1 Tax=Mesorhizobium ventifaucium TaxID=666020 RepID=A0ABN8J9M8_9HYPH|nr:SET domain-containing protein-lysine N-methyltransferase [Mesorhizobium ventifaucium]CAH2394355.1 SET domain-containing protein [Mesorhizobium ventifaucium]